MDKDLLVIKEQLHEVAVEYNIPFVCPEKFTHPAEHEFYKFLKELKDKVLLTLKEHRYQDYLDLLKTIEEPLNKFFSEVQIKSNNKTERHTRESLLCKVRELYEVSGLDWSKLMD